MQLQRILRVLDGDTSLLRAAPHLIPVKSKEEEVKSYRLTLFTLHFLLFTYFLRLTPTVLRGPLRVRALVLVR